MAAFILTNKMVVERCQALFASSKSTFNFPNATREKSGRELADHIARKEPVVAYISDYQGAGKSTLMEMTINTFGFRSERSAMVRARDITISRLEEDLSVFGTLFVDDADIRTTWPKVIDALQLVQGFGADHPCPIVICGDFTIRNEELRSVFDSMPRRDIKMEPIDRRFFLEALNYRLRYLFKKEEQEVPNDANYIFDEELLECLVPNSVIPVATFREVLSLSEGISHQIEPTDEEFHLTKEHAELYCQGRPLSGPDPQQWSFLKLWLKPFCTVTYPLGRGMEPFDAERVLNEIELTDIETPEALAKSILEPLCAAGILHALGFPGIRNGKWDRYPGPYLPRPKFLLYAYAGGEDWPFEDE